MLTINQFLADPINQNAQQLQPPEETYGYIPYFLAGSTIVLVALAIRFFRNYPTQHAPVLSAKPVQKIQTPEEKLVDACRNGNFEELNKAIAEGADIYKQKVTSLLFETCKFYKKENSEDYRNVFDYLITNSAINVNHLDNSRLTALQYAAQNGFDFAVRSLIEKEANVDYATRERSTEPWITAFYLAVKNDHTEAAKILLRKIDLSKDCYKKGHFLHLAASEGHKDIIQLLIDNTVGPNAINELKETPLHIAAEKGNTEAIEALLANKANINALTTGNKTPLFKAVEAEQLKAAETLLKHNANVSIANDRGQQPIHVACNAKDSIKFVTLLINNGANPNASTKQGFTPLDYAKDNAELCNVLIQRGATSKQPFLSEGKKNA